MKGARTYLDWNATAPLRPEARAAMLAALDAAGNPSAVHAEGRAARAIVEVARGRVAVAVGCEPEEVVFTSGATEAASVLRQFDEGVRVQPTAHDCLWAHRDRDDGDAAVYAAGIANGETGMLADPPERDGDAWRLPNGRARRLLLDAVQAVGRVPFAFSWSGADFAILSAHKIGGPKGAGALLVRRGVDLPPLLAGGGQEGGRRSGTENVAAIAGFGAAAEAATQDSGEVWDRVGKIRNILESALVSGAPDTIVIGEGERRLPNTSCFASPGWKGETQVMAMDLAGFAVSAGSACSSGRVRSGRVLRALGYDAETAVSAIRVSIGPDTTEDEVLGFAEAWIAQKRKFRARAA